MDYDDNATLFAPRAAGDPLPPEDWAGFVAPDTSRAIESDSPELHAAAVYAAEKPRLARFLRGRAPAQEIGDLVQECFRRLTSSASYPRVLAEQPGAYSTRPTSRVSRAVRRSRAPIPGERQKRVISNMSAPRGTGPATRSG